MVVAVGNPFAWFNQMGAHDEPTRRTFFRTTGREVDHLIGAKKGFQLVIARQRMKEDRCTSVQRDAGGD